METDGFRSSLILCTSSNVSFADFFKLSTGVYVSSYFCCFTFGPIFTKLDCASNDTYALYMLNLSKRFRLNEVKDFEAD